MLFNSLAFVVFFVVVTGVYFSLPAAKRWIWLLLASCFFYLCYVPWFILVIGTTIIIDYFAGIKISKSTGTQAKKWLVLSLIANLGILIVFKYAGFLTANANGLLSAIGLDLRFPLLELLLPLGLSFHTFQAMSYNIEVYRGHQAPEYHFGRYALYVMFYPQMVAGPIERPQNLLPQLKNLPDFNYDNALVGLRLIFWGFFKKIMVADRAALVSDPVFLNPHLYSSPHILMATALFAFRIYCDFSGYTDIARGCAKVMGIDLMENFKQPYLSTSVTEFWRRWHISLSTWFRDYLYIPLGGHSGSKLRMAMVLLFTFLISGLWHGADWKFVIWGGLNGVYILVERWLKWPYWASKLTWLRRIWVFALICISWIFFAAPDLNRAWQAIVELFNKPSFVYYGHKELYKDCFYALMGIVILKWVDWQIYSGKTLNNLLPKSVYLRWACYFILLWSILLFGVWGEKQFIYFIF